jgi:SRSO17 transposase
VREQESQTGLLKKGRQSAGVARQYRGTAGRVDNCQIGIFLAYVSARGHALLDRELYGPKEWTQDRARCAGAGRPAERQFATKPAVAQRLLAQAFQAGGPATWGTGDSVYGDDRRLRMWLEAQARAYVLAVSGKEYVWLGWQQRQGKTVLAAWPGDDWTRHSAGAGAKGPRWYDWCWLPLAAPMLHAWRRWLLVRRHVSEPTDLTAFVVLAPQTTTLAEAVRAAGMRWTIASSCAAAKGEGGLDHYEVRSWTGWYRPITLAMWAYALLTVVRARYLQEVALPQKNAGPSGLEQSGSLQSGAEPWVPFSVPEIHRLLWRRVLATRQTIGQMLDSSAWRRWHQGVAQFYHYKRRTVP